MLGADILQISIDCRGSGGQDASPCQISSTVAEIPSFFSFFKVAAVRLELIWTTHKEYLMVSIIVQKFGYNRFSSFENMKVSDSPPKG